MKIAYYIILFIPFLFFGQNKPLKLNLLSVTSTDSIPDERKFVVNYSIENTTNKEISFFLNPEKLSPAHTNPMGTVIFYKLFQGNDELIINGIFYTKVFKTLEGFPDFSKITDEKELEEATKKFFEAYRKKEKEKEKLDSINGVSPEIGLKQRTSNELINSIYTLKPNETKTYTTTWYWDKKRYFKRDSFEYYLDEKGTFYVQFFLFLMKEQYQTKLTNEDYETLLKIPNFIKGIYQSEKIEINFRE